MTVSTMNRPAFPPGHDYKEYPEYREYVRKLKCVGCGHTSHKDADGEPIQQYDEPPQLVSVSDPHHVKTRGSGAPDAENLVPLCRVHHSECHQLGITEFQLRYNLDLKSIARYVYRTFLDQLQGADFALKVQARHKLIESRLHAVNMDALAIGQMLDSMKHERLGDKAGFQWMGFSNFESYCSAPIDSGGLGMNPRTAYRCLAFARVEADEDIERADLVQLGATKTGIIKSLLDKAESPEAKQGIVRTAQSLSQTDLIAYRNDQLGLPDPRTSAHNRVVLELTTIFDSLGIEVDDGGITSMAWAVIEAVHNRKGYRGNGQH